MANKARRAWFLATVLAGASLLSGCGKKTYPVEGQVVFENGVPAKELVGYSIVFQSEAHKASAEGRIQADGSFRVGTFQDGDGAMLGKQRVAVTPPVFELDGPKPPPLIAKKYGSFETSNLEVDIKAETNKVIVKVERLRE